MDMKLHRCNIQFCGRYKSVLYQVENRSLYGYPENKAITEEQMNAFLIRIAEDITEELSEMRFSLTMVELLENNECHINVFPFDFRHNDNPCNRKRTASVNLTFWVSVLSTFILVNHDTPSCIQLWRWAKAGHREQRWTEKALENWNIRMEGKMLLFGESNNTSYTAYRKLFERHINTKPLNTEEALKAATLRK